MSAPPPYEGGKGKVFYISSHYKGGARRGGVDYVSSPLIMCARRDEVPTTSAPPLSGGKGMTFRAIPLND